ncbi:MAG: RagB/SusD family nutrient uptake outer membrane protein [Dysgonomonas sp.]
MKNKYIIPVLFALLVGCWNTSCDDYLNVNPDNRPDINTEDKVIKLLVSAYPNCNYPYIFEMMSDNSDEFEGNWSEYNYTQQQAYKWDEMTNSGDNDSPYHLWESSYTAISSANLALKSIEEMGGATTATLRAAKGEALMCRAYNHFILANIFCQAYGANSSSDMGIPYSDFVESEVSPHYERGTVEEVYQKINDDIEEALPLIDNNIYKIPQYHFNRSAAYAFAARFNLFYGKDFQKVIDYSSQVLTENPSGVLRDWAYFSSLDVNEMIPGNDFINSSASLMLISAYSDYGLILANYGLGTKYGHGLYLSTTETFSSNGPWGDENAFYFKAFQNSSAMPRVFLRKVNRYVEYTDPVAGIGYACSVLPAFTTDETLLNRAEAYALTKQYDRAIEDVNTLLGNLCKTNINKTNLELDSVVKYYARMNYYTPTKPTPKKVINSGTYTIVNDGVMENLLQYILHVRRITTIHEGMRWFDVKRYGMEIYRRRFSKMNEITVTDFLPANDLRRAVQLPQEVTSAGLPANPRP